MNREVTLTLPRLPDVGGWMRRIAGRQPLGGGTSWSAPVWIAVAAVVVALSVLNSWLLAERNADADVDSARAAALEEARTRVPVLLSYSSDTLTEDLESAEEQATGDFADDYAEILDDVVRPNARRHGISTEAVVEESAIVDGDLEEVVVLVFLTQTTLSEGDAVPEVTGSRVEVTMAEVDGRWMVAGLEPV